MAQPQIVLEYDSTLDNLGSRSSLATPVQNKRQACPVFCSLPMFKVHSNF